MKDVKNAAPPLIYKPESISSGSNGGAFAAAAVAFPTIALPPQATVGRSAAAAAGVQTVAKSPSLVTAGGAVSTLLPLQTSVAIPLKPKPKSKYEIEPCVVCMDERPTHVILECGHICMCQLCVTTFIKLKKTTCPKCRQSIKQWKKIYF